MKILGVIPARGGSKGVPGKNFKVLAGKPLIIHTIEAAMASNLTKVILSTDSPEIAEIGAVSGIEIPFTRPAELASDTAKSIDVAKHALLAMEEIDGVQYDAIMLLQPTTPYRSKEDINEAVRMLTENARADSVISVVDTGGHHPARMKYLKEGFLIDPPFCEAYENQNRQELEPMYIRNGAIYLTRRDTLLSDSYKGKNCLALVMPESRSVNIDTARDFAYADWLSKQ